jgi:hypothetical protein
VIGISSDSVASHKAFADKFRLPFRLLSDPDGKVRSTFGVPSTFGLLPDCVTYVIDKQGVIRHAFNSQLNPLQHVDEALAVLAHLACDALFTAARRSSYRPPNVQERRASHRSRLARPVRCCFATEVHVAMSGIGGAEFPREIRHGAALVQSDGLLGVARGVFEANW